MKAWVRAVLLLQGASVLCSCALLSKSEPQTPLYFTPSASSSQARAGTVEQGSTLRPLRLGRITSSAHLRERMVYRDEQGRVAYYEERRWTERPEAYLRRALSRALFEERGFKRTVTGVGASLDVELTAFEELRGPKPVARLEATVLLEDGRTSLFEHTFVVERPIASSDENDRDSASVLAHSEALHQVVAQIADRIATSMATLPPDPEPAPLEPRPTSPAKP